MRLLYKDEIMKWSMVLLLLLTHITHITHTFAEPVFTCNFDNHDSSTYTVEMLNQDWNSPLWENGVSEGRVSIDIINNNPCLKVFYPKDSVGIGAKWEMDLDSLYDTLWISYSIMFQENFEFVRGGKLPGLGGGSTPTGGQATDGTDGFSARIMWRVRNIGNEDRGAICQYMYHMDKPGVYGEDLFWAYPDYSQNQTKRFFTPGQWHSVKTRIIINSPGEFDGRVTSWLDRDLGLDSTIRYRADGVSSFAIDKFLFSTFFGGSDSTWAPLKDEYIYFDDFIISTDDPDIETEISVPYKTEAFTNVSITDNSISVYGVNEGEIKVFNIRGRMIYSSRAQTESGKLSFNWNRAQTAPGVYIISLKTDRFQKQFSTIVN